MIFLVFLVYYMTVLDKNDFYTIWDIGRILVKNESKFESKYLQKYA